jgi:hypothetical protein
MGKWRIIDGPRQEENTQGFDGQVWLAMIENASNPSQRAFVQVAIAPTALAVTPDWLTGNVKDAVESHGRTAIEMFLDERDPPRKILVRTIGIRPAESE